jgi:uncharacterized membrane protein
MRKNSLFYNFLPENAFIFIGIIFGILFLLVTPPFQVPDEPSHFYRAFYVSEFGILAQKIDSKPETPETLFQIRKEGTFIEAKAKEDANMQVRRSVYEAVPAEVAHKIMRYIGRAFETGDQQVFKFQLIENSKVHKYEAKITKIKGDEVLAGVHEITSVSGRVGAFLPESLVLTQFRVMDNIHFHPEEKQNVHEIFSLLKLPLNSDKKLFAEFPNTALYAPFPYIPQASGIALGKILNFSPLILVYMGRIFNLSAWIFLIYLAIKNTPVSKWLFFLLALTPMSLFQASSLSVDAFTNGIAFLLIALFLLYSFDEAKAIKRVDILIIFLLSLLLSLSKQVYFLIIFLFLLIPVKKFGTKKKYFITFALLCLLSITALALWSSLAKEIYVPYPVRPLAEPDEQILFIFGHPLQYTKIFINTFIHEGVNYLKQFVGRLGWIDTKLPDLLIFSYLLILMFVAIVDNQKRIAIHYKEKILMAMVIFLTITLTSTMMYITWTAVGGNIIEGIQGRYFIPVAPLFFLLFYNKKFSFKIHRLDLVIILCSLLTLSLTLFVLFKRYYLK